MAERKHESNSADPGAKSVGWIPIIGGIATAVTMLSTLVTGNAQFKTVAAFALFVAAPVAVLGWHFPDGRMPPQERSGV